MRGRGHLSEHIPTLGLDLPGIGLAGRFTGEVQPRYGRHRGKGFTPKAERYQCL